MFGFIFEIIIFIVIFRAILDSKKNRQRKQQTSQGATPPPVGSRPATPSYKPPVPNKPAAKKQKTGWTPRPEKTKTAVPNRPNPGEEASDAETSARSFIEPTQMSTHLLSKKALYVTCFPRLHPVPSPCFHYFPRYFLTYCPV